MTTTLRSRPLFTMHITLHPFQDVGATPSGMRRVWPVSGGTFQGDRLRGTILPHGGADWLIQRSDGAFQLDVRMTLRTDDGALIGITYRGVRHSSDDVAAKIARGEPVAASEYYLRTTPSFETSDRRYAWLNTIVSVGVGERLPDGAKYDVFEVL